MPVVQLKCNTMNTYSKISRPAFSRMLKAEVAEFATKTVQIVVNNNPDELLIDPVFDPLRELLPEIKLLGIRYGIDPHRAKIETSKSKLMLTVSTLKLQTRLLSKGGMDEELYTIQSIIDTYLRYLNAPKKNDKVVVQQVKGFLNELSTNVAFADALDKHNLIDNASAISEALDNYRDAIENRLEQRALRPSVNTLQIIGRVSHAIDTLFMGIEVAQLVNSELDYEPLVSELNELVSNYRLSINLRTAYNRRKAEEEKANMPNQGNGDEGDMGEEDASAENGELEVMPTSTRSLPSFAPYRMAIPSASGVVDVVGKADEKTSEKEASDETLSNGGLKGEGKPVDELADA